MPIFLVDRNGMPISMRNYNHYPDPLPALSYRTHNNRYDVTFHSDTIQTLLTSEPSLVESWLSETLRLHRARPLIVGLDIEWRPNTQRQNHNPVATLQLCINRRCLIFQIFHAPFLPQSLVSFLSSPNRTFVGVGIQGDVDKLLQDYSLRVANFVDLRSLAAHVLGDPDLMRVGLKALAQRVLGKEVEKPERVTRSKWDNAWLSPEQVRYATIDAFVSFQIGRRLYSS